MRKLIVTNMMTLDGYYEGPGKNVMDLFRYRTDYPADEQFDIYNAERLHAADTLLLGRKSFEGFMGYWPSVADDTTATPINREISRLNNAIQKVVISDHLTAEATGPWRQTTRIIPRAQADEQISKLKRDAGKDILVFGSHILWNNLLANGLVDELHLLISPVVLGAGTPLFDSQPNASLRLIDACTWDSSALVLVRYDARRAIE
jgi:dihydrofolate reductase